MTDTSPEIARMVHDRLMALSGPERLRLGVRSFDVARRLVLASFPAGLSDHERKRRLFQRIYGVPLPVDVEEKMNTA